MDDFGSYIKRIRESKNMTLNQVALYAEISAAQLSRIETGKRGTPKPMTIERIAKALRVDYEELMVKAGYIEASKPLEDDDKLEYYKRKIVNEFPDIDLMFKDMASLSGDDLEEVYEYIKFKMNQKKGGS